MRFHDCLPQGRNNSNDEAVVKNPYEVLLLKQQQILQLRQETEALRLVIELLDKDEEEDALCAAPVPRHAVAILTNPDN